MGLTSVFGVHASELTEPPTTLVQATPDVLVNPYVEGLASSSPKKPWMFTGITSKPMFLRPVFNVELKTCTERPVSAAAPAAPLATPAGVLPMSGRFITMM